MDVLNSSIFSFLTGAGVLIAGIGFAYSQFKSGAAKAKDDLIDTLRETALAEKQKAERLAAEKTLIVTSHQEQLNQLNEKLGKLQGLYEANESQKKEYLAILQGRNPAQEKFVLEISQTAKNAEIFMKNQTLVTEQVLKFMKLIEARTTITQAGVDSITQHTS